MSKGIRGYLLKIGIKNGCAKGCKKCPLKKICLTPKIIKGEIKC